MAGCMVVALCSSDHFEDGSARVGNVRQRVPEEREVLEHNEDCTHSFEQTTRHSEGKDLLMERVPLRSTKAETKIIMIIAKTMIVATTRTGLNIWWRV